MALPGDCMEPVELMDDFADHSIQPIWRLAEVASKHSWVPAELLVGNCIRIVTALEFQARVVVIGTTQVLLAP